MGRQSAMVVVVLLLVTIECVVGVQDAEILHDPKLRERARRNNISCLLVFGDSSVDPGNNNVLNTTFKGNFLPYGIDFLHHQPTGRFCNGRLTTDFIAEALGIKYAIPPFLKPGLRREELIHGVSFASAASGYDDLTANLTNVLPIRKQIQYLMHYMVQLRQFVGEQKERETIKNAIIVISAGTNDFIQNYFITPGRSKEFTIDQYIDFLIKCLARDIQEMHALGATRFVVVGVPPLGCMPLVQALHGKNECVAEINQVVVKFNNKIRQKLDTANLWLGAQATTTYVDAYSVLLNAIAQPAKYGFSVSTKGCCGSGVIEFGDTCKGQSTCSDPSKYVFWDAVHPSERMYQIIAIEAIKQVNKQMI
ncbi:GDSL esterase/lipase At5g45950 [Nymphaea colorata]|nr:GDSL esterase/lipase At5g45950 [Nymphaea colorata]